MVRHQAALAAGQLTRVTSGVNLPPPAVIMSRPETRNCGTTSEISSGGDKEFVYNACGGILRSLPALEEKPWQFDNLATAKKSMHDTATKSTSGRDGRRWEQTTPGSSYASSVEPEH